MIKQIFVNGVFYRLMDDDETNDIDEIQRIQDEFPNAVIAIIESLDGSNQHEPVESTIVTLDTINATNVIEATVTDLTIPISDLK
jgi:hypothetical protein